MLLLPKKGLQAQHVVANNSNGISGWAVKRAGAARASRTFTTQIEAVAYGKALAKDSRTELFIHGKDGRIRERNSYSHDPFAPKG